MGQGAVEEIDIVRNGGNYGWRIWEGSTCTGNDPSLCTTAGFEFPIAEYGHTGGRCAVIGGYVYRGAAATLPAGSYVYGDLCTGEIFLLENGSPRVLLDSGLSLSSFGEDEAGEIYAVSTGGSVARLVNVCAPGATGDPLCSLRLSAGMSQPSFAPGETLTATVGFDNPGLAETADVYIGVLQPDQTVLTFTSAGPRHDLRAARDGRGADIAVRDNQAALPRLSMGWEASSAASTRSSCSPSAPAPLRTASSHPRRSSPSPPRRSPFRNSDGPRAAHFPFSRTSSSGAAHGYGSISIRPGSATRGPIPLTQMNS